MLATGVVIHELVFFFIRMWLWLVTSNINLFGYKGFHTLINA